MREVRGVRIAPATIIAACLLVVSACSARAATGDITTVVAGLANPAGLSSDAAGNVYIADQNNNQVVKYDVATATSSPFITGLSTPTGILVDKAGNVYIANTLANNVLKRDALTGTLTVIAGNGTAATSGDGGPALAAGINAPCSLAMDVAGNLYIAQRGGATQDRVRLMDLNGNISTIAGGGAAPVSSGASATSVAITFQLGGNYIGVDIVGNLFIADESQNYVYKVSNGFISIIGGTGANGFGGDGGPATAALIDDPTSIAVDALGNVFVSNDNSVSAAGDYYIRKIDAATNIISRLAGTGVAGFSGDGGPGTLAQISTATDYGGVCVDVFGNVYFSDFNNNRVRRLEGVAVPTPPPGPTPTFIYRGSVGTAFSATLPAAGPYTLSPATGLPPGLSIAGNAITGTPTGAGTFAINFTTSNAAFRVYIVITANTLALGNNGNGPLPIPRFTLIPSGGTAPVDVIVDPSESYLPVSGISNQRYLYQARWDYGDGTAEIIPTTPSPDPNAVLIPRVHTYIRPGLYNIRLTILVTIEVLDPTTGLPVAPAQQFEGPGAFTDQQVRVADVNYQPLPSGLNTGSPIGDGNIPFNAQITASLGGDQDGYIVWAAIDWGDGTIDVIPANQLPPNLPTIPLNHTYTAPGTYKVTISVIDNGRIPLGFAPPTGPADAQAALQYYKNYQASLPIATFGPAFLNLSINPSAPTALASIFDPQLRQDFLFITVPGNMTGLRGQFLLDFRSTAKDKYQQTLKANIQPATVANTSVTLTLGSGAGALTKTFTTDRRGRFREKTFSFSYNAKTNIITIKFTNATLAAAFGRTNATVVNQSVDVPLTLAFGTTSTLKTTLTFAYNSKQGQKGIGKRGLTKLYVP